MSDSDTLPAFIFPKQIRDWKMGLRSVRVGDLRNKESAEREYSILGGGDIGFPLMLAVSVFFKAGLGGAAIVGVFALVGLMGAFLIQLLWLKDKPVPALPPIAFAALVGFLITELAF
ncbi:MAG TPA: presenilin family intramembrane aspartyl protease, partial [Dehalococcoidales bacterium]|nr:presenilin family intramembrane aspartyl protease [Dehalococcoidales bacterium]